MVSAIQIPAEYGYVLLAGFSTFLVGTWNGMYVSSYRKAAKIPYPYEYASYEQIQAAPPAEAKAMLLFNCAQRSHQNFNENHVTALGSMLISGLVYPRAAAVLGGTWAVNRVAYALGYTNGKDNGRGRYNGAVGMLAHVVMMGLAGKSLWDIFRA
ncbi:membrane-associated proteins in eicosanoid and glutathione metabolism [Pleomassaria siparia CBS 279.74]|uniref:Membrane-associated proteins in eicosanoid and glutathione metabolism n=1 Tax=Pleomassaria siparia CBS 279.74 TaxID=1314801 RepID=A0A6G1KP98_9PLEO|nr:membrane-associated proteins in eicosanoid and glutathione metabolism [Pleomassaria siparia CBS 279.74]